ncbi:MAG: 3-isopropylmalate dehydratase large subunit, partial [Alphaproteobacteria bacterium]|nr:3-isopropylmalate dehydratase large subunit [Alphaproteobacteria bacterium]
MGKTLFDKIWDAHVIARRDTGDELLYVDRHLIHDLHFRVFDTLTAAGHTIREPDKLFGVPDHSLPTTAKVLEDIPAGEMREAVAVLERQAEAHHFTHFPMTDVRHGIVHVVGPEQGITLPGLLLVCGDSHTSTHGALGCLAFGIGSTEVRHVLATQTIWQRKPKRMRIIVDGAFSAGVSGKDVALAIIALIGTAGGTGHAIEYAGSAIEALSMEGRMTLCNMTIEAGARCGMVAPDAKTIEYVRDRPYAPAADRWDEAVRYWQSLPSDPDAVFDREVSLDASGIEPMVTWGNSPQWAVGVSRPIPDPADETDPMRRTEMEAALDYMGLKPGMALDDIVVDRVFIGSCTNSRIEDLRAAAA